MSELLFKTELLIYGLSIAGPIICAKMIVRENVRTPMILNIFNLVNNIS